MRLLYAFPAILVLVFSAISGIAQAPAKPPQPSTPPAQSSAQSEKDAEAQAEQAAQQLVKKHEAWLTQITTPGATIEARESGREGGKVSYSIYVKGLAGDKLYTIVSWPVSKISPFPAFKGVSIAQDGRVSCTGRLPGECTDASTKDQGVLQFTFTPVKGEPFRIALINGDAKAAIVIVPDPITAEDKGCTLHAVRLLPRFELAYFSGSGYPPNTDVSFNSQSYEEKHVVAEHSDSAGIIRFAMMPFVTGHTNGTTTITATGTACAPTLQFDWGAPPPAAKP
jgi:hypothetical protein